MYNILYPYALRIEVVRDNVHYDVLVITRYLLMLNKNLIIYSHISKKYRLYGIGT